MNLSQLQAFRLAPIVHCYDAKDSMLYALGLGYGADPTDQKQVQFVYENGLKAVPSICVVLAHPGFWINDPKLEIDWVKVLHGEQAFTLHRPLTPEGAVRGEYEVLAVEDKGPKGAVMHVAKRLYDDATNELIADVTSVYMLRGDGGCGNFGTPPAPPAPLPEREPDMVVNIPTLPQAALIYRLSGDRNPIHADPAAARKAGFAQPILHGLCSMGIATRALVDAVADGDPDRLKTVSLRFSSPVYPGETLRIAIFREGGGYRFSARALERDIVVLDRGTATLHD
ncbi:N-terminal half of MaoC dehydratase [Sphingobium faniae]|nr:N-terminal half of MaoC dehydratase [Sphingobium faniae]